MRPIASACVWPGCTGSRPVSGSALAGSAVSGRRSERFQNRTAASRSGSIEPGATRSATGVEAPAARSTQSWGDGSFPAPDDSALGDAWRAAWAAMAQPDRADATSALAIARRGAAQGARIAAVFDHLPLANPAYPDGNGLADQLSLAARVLAAHKQVAAAEAEFCKALEFNPNLVEAHYALARFYQATGRKAEAEREYKILSALHARDKGSLSGIAGREQ